MTENRGVPSLALCREVAMTTELKAIELNMRLPPPTVAHRANLGRNSAVYSRSPAIWTV
jgi:hypothetical protein